MLKTRGNWLLLSLICLGIGIVFAGCGGGGNPPNNGISIAQFRSFSGNSVDLGDLEGYNVYLMIYGSNKDEGNSNDAGSFESIDSLMTYTGNVSLVSSGQTVFHSSTSTNPSTTIDNQAKFERALRQSESEIMKLHPAPAKSQFSAKATPPAIGESRLFYIAFDANFNKTSRTFVCRLKSTNAYFWVDSTDTIINTVLNSYATTFNTIYNTDQNTFGNHWDSDGEPVYILISSVLNGIYGGYFWAGDKFNQSESNRHDMFYMAENNPLDYAMATLAHEFQHMINFDGHYSHSAVSYESPWLNEALSELASYICGYGEASYFKAQEFLHNSYYLTYWNYDAFLPNYGASLLFGRYLYEKYPGAIRNLVNTNKTGIANVEAATSRDFNALVKDFFFAIIFDNTGLANGNPAYEFTTLNLRDTSDGFYGFYEGNIPEFAMATTTVSESFPPYFLNLTKLNGISSSSSISWTTTNNAPLDGAIIYLPAENSL